MHTSPASTDDAIVKGRSRTRSVSRRTAVLLGGLIWIVAVPMAHGVAPWAISLLSPRRGWERGGPGLANLLGVLPIAIGIAGLAWTMVAAFRHIPDRMELRLPAFLMTRGPYSYSRNPMYASELVLWLGWAVLYGSVAVLFALVAFSAMLVVAVQYEERLLTARFGEAYRAYRNRVPRWLGTRRRRDSRVPYS
jgi:protein-S-isoprenylcysteine O-methyltransferase Ste14